MNNNESKPVVTLGERKIIQIIKSRLSPMPNLPVPFGDDVSAVSLGGENVAVLKMDMLVAKTDVPPKMSFYQAARKAVIMNISDFASKGVQPTAALVSLGIPREFSVQDIHEVADGLNAGAREYGAYVIGGDTNEASDLVVSISLFGTAKKATLMLRGGAKAGDVLAVTGFFGKSSSGLRLLLDEDCKPPATGVEALVDAVLMPKARLAEGIALTRSGAVSASMDSSDGLAVSLHQIAEASGVGFVVDALPIAEEVGEFAKLNLLDPQELALYGGEEYELVVTIGPSKWEAAKTAVEAVGGSLYPIGHATSQKQVVLDLAGEKRAVEFRGWEHFKSQR